MTILPWASANIPVALRVRGSPEALPDILSPPQNTDSCSPTKESTEDPFPSVSHGHVNGTGEVGPRAPGSGTRTRREEHRLAPEQVSSLLIVL